MKTTQMRNMVSEHSQGEHATPLTVWWISLRELMYAEIVDMIRRGAVSGLFPFADKSMIYQTRLLMQTSMYKF